MVRRPRPRPKMGIKSKEKILQINITQSALNELENMMEELKASTKTEVVKRSLGLMKLVIEEEAKGGEIIIRDKKGREKRIERLNIINR